MSFHQKRLSSSKVLSIPKKKYKWVTRPSPGPHPKDRSIPLLVAVRDELSMCDTSREARRIIGNREVAVDMRPTRDFKRPLGLMDTISIPKAKEHFRVLLDRKGRLRMVRIEEDEAAWKLVRIEDKTTLRGGRTQLNCHDGRNILIDKDEYKTGDVLKLELPEQKVIAHYPMEKGAVAMVVSGAHTGEMSTVSQRVPTRGSSEDLIEFEDGFATVKSNVFIVGSEKAELSVPEVSI
jgi:small subunit ribosomal protein S4e